MMAAEVYLLCGLAGSGKTSYSRLLEAQGAIRLSVDELVFERDGRYGIDYDQAEYKERRDVAAVELENRLVELVVHQAPTIVVDHGLWTREGRGHYKRLVEEHGGTWRLLYFKASAAVLLERLSQRSRRTDPNAFPVTKSMLDDLIRRFEPPSGEGEEVIDQDVGGS